MRLIDSFFSPYFSRRRRGPFTDPADRITRHLEYLFMHSVCLCTDGVCVRAYVYVHTCIYRGGHDFSERINTIERDGSEERKEQENCLSLSLLSLSLSFSYVYVWVYDTKNDARRGTRYERREFPVVNVFGCICPSLLSPSHARARVPIKAPIG